MRAFDKNFLSDKIKFIAGADEAGRGPLAGPVVAASVILPTNVIIRGVNDSKKLTQNEREKLFKRITERCLCYSVSVINNRKIDEINILNASLLAMKIATSRLTTQPDLLLVDGNKSFNYNCEVTPVVKGDSLSYCIAAASIIAKVTRDRIMERLAEHYPVYFWNSNKGYPTVEHIKAIRANGYTPLHRKTFLRKILNKEHQYSFELSTAEKDAIY